MKKGIGILLIASGIIFGITCTGLLFTDGVFYLFLFILLAFPLFMAGQWLRIDHSLTKQIMVKFTAIFVGIHPFIDGDGRTSRLLLNSEVMKDGFPPVIIKVENRLAYYEALDKAHTTEDYSDFIALVEREVEDSLDLYLSTIS
ncbi:Fic family protein [Sporosarcina sp. D27]|uniref:Fic family protein n=1 Tax=Sporosarcina sp. D27 TaxID=1382305 RepID=UPI00046F1691|nr:Fic family protein [Sporosarcina sp. D27]